MLPTFPLLNTAAAIQRMGDEEIYLEIARFFADNLDTVITNLEGAITSSSMEKATRLAHSLKSNCATIGSDALRDQCASLEILCRNGAQDEALLLFIGIIPTLQKVRSIIRML